jgi:hypothetical protein
MEDLGLEKKVQEMSPIELAEGYSKLIELKAEVEVRYKAFREALLEATKKHGVLSLKTEKYTISRQKRSTVKVTDQKTAIRELEEKGIEVVTKVVLDEEYMKPVYEQLIKDGEFIPGIETFTTEFVTVRATSKK